MPFNATHCPFCKTALDEPSKNNSRRSSFVYSCPHCGRFQLTEEADADLGGYIRSHGDSLPYIPHAIRKLTASENAGPLIASDTIRKLFENPPKPSPREQADNFILWIGDNQADPGKPVEIRSSAIRGIVGAASDEGLVYLLESLKRSGLVDGTFTGALMVVIDDDPSSYAHEPDDMFGSLSLTFTGWDRYAELKRGAPSGTTAFMAMQFGNTDLDEMVKTCFRPAVEATGFELRRLNDPEHQRAGLIDDRLRVEIKKSRFVISDLTHANNGAYWEAGYAEGLGKDVIYTCEKSVFDQRQKEGGGTHFDTNHHLHILWESSNPGKAADDLKACIRATIPEAKQEG
jgi:hypothetical protein